MSSQPGAVCIPIGLTVQVDTNIDEALFSDSLSHRLHTSANMWDTRRLMDHRQRNAPVTAKDVALLAGVSRSAVSRTFTAGASVSRATRVKVEEAANQLGYSPNLIARSLITRRSGIVGLVLGQMDNPFYAALLSALSERLAGAGKRLMLLGGGNPSVVEEQVEALLHYRVDALMIASVDPSSALVRRCNEVGVHVVMINRVLEDARCSSVVCDNEAGGCAIGHHMASSGCSTVSFMAGLEDSSTSREREKGFMRAVEECGLQFVARMTGSYDFSLAQSAARSMFETGCRPQGIFCANDMMALAVQQVASRDFALEAGNDYVLFGFDDIGLAAWPAFELATFTQPIDGLADAAVSMLHAGEAGRRNNVIVPGELIVRRSGSFRNAADHSAECRPASHRMSP